MTSALNGCNQPVVKREGRRSESENQSSPVYSVLFSLSFCSLPCVFDFGLCFLREEEKRVKKEGYLLFPVVCVV